MWGVKIKGALFFSIYGMCSVLSKHDYVCCLFFVHSDEVITEVETRGCIYAPSNGC